MIIPFGSRILRNGSIQRGLVVLVISVMAFSLSARQGEHTGTDTTVRIEELTQRIPGRPEGGLTGSQFAQYVSKMDSRGREQAILEEISKGNLPKFLRRLVPVDLHYELANGKTLTATIFVTPDYLAIGSDSDFLRIPMNLHTAAAIAERFGFVLPTKRMVDAIYLQSRYHLVPQPLPAGPEMRSTAYYWTHNRMIENQAHALGVRLGELVSGDKKDVVVTNRLAMKAGRIAIYGWHLGPDQPIQPLSTLHGANYADYSHGIRLISDWALIDGKLRLIRDILQDSSAAEVLSDEGPIRVNWGLLAARHDTSAVVAGGSN